MAIHLSNNVGGSNPPGRTYLSFERFSRDRRESPESERISRRMVLAAAPNWLGSPQHVVGGVVLALIVVVTARLRGISVWLAIALGIGVASTAEILVELVEYPLLYSDKFHYSAYYDTLADMASTLVGAILGAGIGAYAIETRRRRQRSLD
jgi:hypothetical protein